MPCCTPAGALPGARPNATRPPDSERLASLRNRTRRESARFGQAGTTVSSPKPASPRATDPSDWEWDSPSVSTQPGTPLDAEAITLARHRPAEPAFRPGDKVQHATFGMGVILSVEGEGASAEVKVHFSGKGMKRLALAYAQLTKLERSPRNPWLRMRREDRRVIDAPEPRR